MSLLLLAISPNGANWYETRRDGEQYEVLFDNLEQAADRVAELRARHDPRTRWFATELEEIHVND